jgi:hypothetical protein
MTFDSLSVETQESQEYFGVLFSQSCIMHVADLDPMWCKCLVEDNIMKRLSICETLQKDVTRLMTSIENNPHAASELWIVAIICPAGMHAHSQHTTCLH